MKWKYGKHIFVFCAAALILNAPTLMSKAYDLKPIKSHGTVIYKNEDGSKMIELYASDIQYLHDELDKLFAELPDYSNRVQTTSYPISSWTPVEVESTHEAQDRLGGESIISE